MDNRWLTEPLPDGAEECEVRRRQFLNMVATLGGMVLFDRAARLATLGDTRIDRELVDELAGITRNLAARWNETDPRTWLRTLTGHHAVLGVLAMSASPMFQTELQHLAGRTAALEGLAHRFIGHPHDAAESFRAADIWATRSGDDRLRALAHVWGSDILSAVQRGRPGPSPSSVRQQLDEAERLLGADPPPALAAQVLLRQAEEHAADGEVHEALRYMERNETIWANGTGHDEGLFGMPWVGTINRAFRGNILMLAGRPREAIAVLDEVLGEYPARMVSDRIAARTDLGAALARSGQLEHGCELLAEAWGHAVGVGLADRIGRLAGIRERDLALFAAEPAVRQLDERMGALA